MPWLVLEACLLALLGAIALWTAAHLARARPRREAQRRALRELAAGHGQPAGDDEASIELDGAAFTVRLIHAPRVREALVIGLPLEQASPDLAEPAGYRATGRDRMSGRPWIGVRRGARA